MHACAIKRGTFVSLVQSNNKNNNDIQIQQATTSNRATTDDAGQQTSLAPIPVVKSFAQLDRMRWRFKKEHERLSHNELAYRVRSVFVALKVNHTIYTSEGGAVTSTAMGIEFFLGEHITAGL
jgi:hypothetical protein